MRKLLTSPTVGSVQCSSSGGLRQLWDRLSDVKFISQAAEDEQLAEIERIAREKLDAESALFLCSHAQQGPCASS